MTNIISEEKIKFLAEQAVRIQEALEGRTAELIEDRNRKKQRGVKLPPLPPSSDYDIFHGLVKTFLETLSNEGAASDKAHELARQIDSTKVAIIGDRQNSVWTNFSGIAEIFGQTAELAAQFVETATITLQGVEAADSLKTSKGWPTNYQTAIPKNEIPKNLSAEDAQFYSRYWPAAHFMALHKNGLEASDVPQDHQLLHCIDLSLAVASDYLGGFDFNARDTASVASQINCTAQDMREKGCDLKSFPYNFCLTAKNLAGIVHSRVSNGIQPSAELKETLLIPQEEAPSLPKAKKTVISALSKGQTPPSPP